MATATAPAPATKTPTQLVMDRFDSFEKSFEKRVGTIESELTKLATETASKAGMTGEALMADMTNGGRKSVLLGPDGREIAPALLPGGRKSFLGEIQREDGKKGSFGDFLVQFRRFHNVQELSEPERMKAHAELKGYGVQQYGYDVNEKVVKTALAESSGVTGGYTVPPQFERQLFELAIEDSIVQPRARKYPMVSKSLTIPALDQTNTGFAAAAGVSNLLGGVQAFWTTEAATRIESEPGFRQIILNAWELSFYALASNNLLADSAIALDSFLTQLMGYAIGWYTDFSFLQGNGVGQPLGILNAPATVQVQPQVAAHFSLQDVAKMLSTLYWMLRGSTSLCWVIHQSVIADLYKMNDMRGAQTTNGFGQVVFIPLDQGVQAPIPSSAGVQSIGRLVGFPVLVSEKVPALGSTGCVSLIDMDKYFLGQRMELEIAVSPHVRFLNAQMVWRVVWRGDGQPGVNKQITLADGTFKVSPFVTLAAS